MFQLQLVDNTDKYIHSKHDFENSHFIVFTSKLHISLKKGIRPILGKLVTASDLLPSLLVLLSGLLLDLLGHPNTILTLKTLGNKPVAQELLIEA